MALCLVFLTRIAVKASARAVLGAENDQMTRRFCGKSSSSALAKEGLGLV